MNRQPNPTICEGEEATATSGRRSPWIGFIECVQGSVHRGGTEDARRQPH